MPNDDNEYYDDYNRCASRNDDNEYYNDYNLCASHNDDNDYYHIRLPRLLRYV